uniref:Uncharacterized protein n=1 Tax=Avena sativa TaxID=4498 RepID=A0ACD5YWN2_AVESA
MKIFVRAMHANPSRDNKELVKLLDGLVFPGSLETNAKKMIKFSYNDLPRDYKTCLLYLSIFPKVEKISRSRVAQRWVVEGLVSKEDRHSSLRQAKRCFDQLADRWLVCPAKVSAEGKVKTCTVHDIVRDFITIRARKQHIMDPRLSQHLARHFSVLSNIRLRPSENIINFLMKPSRASSQLQLLKVLDLEGSRFSNYQQYLSNVCNMIALLKFLSLRNTDITRLPKEINKLQQLEVLDIRQTEYLHVSAIKLIVLLKLKHLLAGSVDASWTVSTVRMPHKITRMTALRVLSHVQATEHRAWELHKLGELWQLRKLGVVIDDSRAQLYYLLKGISDLNESLQSLSIEIKPASTYPTAPDTFLANEARRQKPPKFLESLSISGFTNYIWLLPLLTSSHDVLTKVTLQKTTLDQDDMEVLAKLKKLRSLRLRQILHIRDQRELLFKEKERDRTPNNKDKDEENNCFEALKYLVVEGGGIAKIGFQGRAAHNLEKIVWSSGFTEMESLSGLRNLPELKEIDFEGGSIPHQEILEAIPKTVHIKLPYCEGP